MAARKARVQSWQSVKAKKLDSGAQRRVQRAADEALSLRELRRELKVTQVELAELAAMSQSELSRFESRDAHRLSTLRRYVEALGGEVEVTAVVEGRRIRLRDV